QELGLGREVGGVGGGLQTAGGVEGDALAIGDLGALAIAARGPGLADPQVGLDRLGGLRRVGAELGEEGGEGGLGGLVVAGLAEHDGGAEAGVGGLLGVGGLAGV